MSKRVALLAVVGLDCFLTSCSIGPVSAQSSYSNASLSGTYAISFNSTGGSVLLAPDGSSPTFGAVGTLQFDGTGKVNGGEITTFYGTSSCSISLTGTYNIGSAGLGTIRTIPVVTSGGCSVPATWRADFVVGQQGQSFNFASDSGTAGSAVKQ
jgi:hypothetical protein